MIYDSICIIICCLNRIMNKSKCLLSSMVLFCYGPLKYNFDQMLSQTFLNQYQIKFHWSKTPKYYFLMFFHNKKCFSQLFVLYPQFVSTKNQSAKYSQISSDHRISHQIKNVLYLESNTVVSYTEQRLQNHIVITTKLRYRVQCLCTYRSRFWRRSHAAPESPSSLSKQMHTTQNRTHSYYTTIYYHHDIRQHFHTCPSCARTAHSMSSGVAPHNCVIVDVVVVGRHNRE